jgi:hypothetical protein
MIAMSHRWRDHTQDTRTCAWGEVTDDQIALPPRRTKNNREHRISIVPAVRAILDGREHDDTFVFGRHPGNPFSGWGVSKEPGSTDASKRQVTSFRVGGFMIYAARCAPTSVNSALRPMLPNWQSITRARQPDNK